jgi:hypothetical protein
MARSSKGSKGEKLSLNEREFLLASLAEGRRLDGRGLYDYRTLKISFPYQPGYCEVQLGQTRYHFFLDFNPSFHSASFFQSQSTFHSNSKCD